MPAGLGVWELLIIFAVLLLLFGAKRLPEMGRSLGHGMREFKDAVSGIGDEPKKDELQPRTPSATQPSQPSETERVSS